jgi:hypothetical protein
VELTHDLEAIEVDRVETEKFKYEHGAIWSASDEQWFEIQERCLNLRAPSPMLSVTGLSSQDLIAKSNSPPPLWLRFARIPA